MLDSEMKQLTEYSRISGMEQYQAGYRIVWALQFGKKYVLKKTDYVVAPFGSGYYELLLDGNIGPCISYNYDSSD
jgi:hypothetical protein